MKVHLQIPDAEDAITVTLVRAGTGADASHHVSVAEETAELGLEWIDDHGGIVRHLGRVRPFRAVVDGDVVTIWLDGRTRRLERRDPTARRATEGTAAGGVGDLLAPMPGKVLEIAVGPGESFEAHAPIIIMESMKMEMTLSAPRAGRVGRVLCQKGELVEMGARLAELEPAEPREETAP